MKKWILALSLSGGFWVASFSVARASATDNFVEAVAGIVDALRATLEIIVELFRAAL